MSDINTNKRLFDLVRYMRGDLLDAGLITEDEYTWLLSECPMAKGGGSPSPRRLEDYDELRDKLDKANDILKRCEDLFFRTRVYSKEKIIEESLLLRECIAKLNS